METEYTKDISPWEADRQKGMVQGVAYSVATFLKYWGEHPWVHEVWGAAGMSIAECESNGVDEYDMETLRQYEEYLDNRK